MSGVLQQFPLEEEYKKHPDISPNDILKLRQWLHTQPHLPAAHITDLDLILAYHCCDLSPEVTKQVIDLHYTVKTHSTKFFKDRAVDKRTLNVLNNYVLADLEFISYDGSRTLYFSVLNLDPKIFSFAESARAGFMLLDLLQYSEGTWPGITVIFDMKGISLAHVTKVAQELQYIQQYIYFVQECILVKIKGIFILNAPSFMDRLLSLVKPFLKKEFYNMISIHQIGSTTIGKYMPIDGIPDGERQEQIKEETLELFKANSEFFINENDKRVVETSRPGKPKDVSDIFGSVEGSFKKLEID